MEGRFSSSTVRFGSFELDERAGELRKNGLKMRLQEQPLQLLQILLEQPGNLVSREELQRRIWGSDTFVDFDHGINNAIKRLREALGDVAETPRYIETLPRRGYRFIGEVERETSAFRSLAVLPLENLSLDPEQEYFADGFTEALITTLAKIGQLRVVSRGSSMLYKGIRKPPRAIASELNVDAIVEGTVLREGDRVRITAQLIDPEKDAHIWAESYERHLSHVLDLQAEVTQAIARQIQIKLTPQEQAQFATMQPVNPEAYEAYLKGRYYWLTRSREGHVKAVQYFREAIEKDRNWGLAYAGLADGLSILGVWGLVTPDEGCGKAKKLAQEALAKDPGLAEAHTSFAWATAHYDFDFVTAEVEFERALELSPRYALAHHWFGICLAMMERREEAVTELKRAIRLDPHVSVIRWGLGFVHWCGRRYDEAIDALRQALALDPNSAQALVFLVLCYLEKGLLEPAIASGKKAVEISDAAAIAMACLGEAYATAGLCNEAEEILHQLSHFPYLPRHFAARLCLALGRKDKALQLLDEASREHGEWFPLAKVEARFDELRPEPPFNQLLTKVKFSEDTSLPIA